MLRWLYIQLLWAHPAHFRYRFCDEMLEAFDHARESNERVALLLDGVVSIARQWVLRSEFRRPLQPANAAGPAYELITFQQIEPYKPSRFALAQGGLLALLLLLSVVNAINHGGGKIRAFLIGMHRPGNGLIKVDRVEGGPLNTTVEGRRDLEDPWRPYARSYFRVVRVLWELDSDSDLKISALEISEAPDALRRLDANHDGELSAQECGFLPPGDFDGSYALAPYRLNFMRTNAVLAALDRDGDGVISAAEIASSPAALQSLNGAFHRELTPYDLLPSEALSHAASLMSRFDTYDAGVIAIQGVSKEDTDAEQIKAVLHAADRNHDGIVTRGELIVSLSGSAGAAASQQ